MIQALPLVERLGPDLTDARVALACASHRGSAMHTAAVRDWLRDLGSDEDALICGPQEPVDPDERARLAEAGEAPSRLHNNCSGKHAGFLTLARALGAGDDYGRVDHPVQAGFREALEALTNTPRMGHATDGCSAPTFATTIGGLAHAMARFAVATGQDPREAAMARIQRAMIAHPEMVQGEGGRTTAMIRATDGRAFIKDGAEAIWTAILPEAGLGVAMKVVDGADRGAAVAMAALLTGLGALDAGAWPGEDPIADRNGTVVGAVRAEPSLWHGLRR